MMHTRVQSLLKARSEQANLRFHQMHRSSLFIGAMFVLFTYGFFRAVLGHSVTADEYLKEIGIVFGAVAIIAEGARMIGRLWLQHARGKCHDTLLQAPDAEEPEEAVVIILVRRRRPGDNARRVNSEPLGKAAA
ncbi:MAG: hypothetical protein KAY22_03130 [Rhizorhabdus sp.]|uniref:hypothetical protein n=1 Tax=Rhizorhabdus sp. TaxID=1968843 RepID=UPI001B788625|nr:hypothetical protein [Rhizorhabdus sp.]MBP8231275.1 hypothetical protein [Rhizorhabdus sp.]